MASSLKAGGSTTRWRQLRAYVLRRDEGVCHLCGKRGADQVDHVIPRSLGGTDDLANLKAAHGACNRSKGSRVVPTTMGTLDAQPSRSW